MSLEEVVRDAELSLQFLEYLKKHNASEGLMFLIKLNALHELEEQEGISTILLHERALALFEQFVRQDAPDELNLGHDTREEIKTALIAPEADQNATPTETFKEARMEVGNMLGSSLFAQWVASLR